VLVSIPVLLAVFSCGPIAVNTTPSAVLTAETRSVSAMPYRIGPGDDLEIKFTYNPELNERVPVRPDGRISVPLAKQIVAAGLTTEELESLLQQKYTPELKKPDVTVIVRGFYAQTVICDGEVGRPGAVPLMKPMTVMELIAQSGGFKESARTNEVIVIRRTTARPIVAVINLDKARDNSDMSQDIQVIPSDIVYVPRSPIANVDLFVDQYIRRLIPFSLPEVIPTPSYIYQQGSPRY
jgi:protein involved in polysaccharide export with SLBB domain